METYDQVRETRRNQEDGSGWQQNIASLFEPRSIAMVGASEMNPMRAGILRNLKATGFRGRVFPINPSYREVAGTTCYPSLADLPEAPDSVILAIGAQRVPQAFQDAIDVGARSIVVMTGGFSDVDAAGAAVQHQLATLAKDHGVAFLGPNCQGTISFSGSAAQYLLPINPDYRPGSLALISQSGSVTDALTNNQQGVGWSHIASTGNEAVVTAAEILAYLVEQPSCRGVVLFLETIRHPQAFFAACDRAAQLDKPIIVLKSGRTAKAQEAALAHTGALATSDRLIDAKFAAHGIVRVDSMEEALAVAVIVQAGRIPKSNRMSVLLGSGGLVELLHDAGGTIELPDFTHTTKERLSHCVGPWVRRQNPLDYWPTDDIVVNRPLMVEALVADANSDGLIEIEQYHMDPTGGDGFSDGEFGSRLVNIASTTEKFLAIVAPIHGELPPPRVIRRAGEAGVAILSGLETSVRALEKVTTRPHPKSKYQNSVDTTAFSEALNLEEDSFSGAEALHLMRLAGLQVADFAVVHQPQEALSEAERMGFPITVKLADKKLLHKTEMGGVRVGIRSPKELLTAAESLLEKGPILVQRTITGEYAEIIVGLNSDPHLGKFVIVGMGGIWTEILDDAATWPVGHLNPNVAKALLSNLKGYSTLTGARGRSPLNLDGVVETILTIDAIAQEFPEIDSIDLNPLMVTQEAAWVVDSLIVKH